jgi:epsilon-lactone hydrolase
MSFTLQGPFHLKVQSVMRLTSATATVALRRALGRSPVPDWPWNIEAGVLLWRRQTEAAFALKTMDAARKLMDAIAFEPLSRLDVSVTASSPSEPPGKWFVPSTVDANRVVLYFHGGGYGFYVRSHASMIGYVAQAARARTFALDYRLTPEHPHPAQLMDALSAYRWLLATGHDPQSIILAGDSAGGHLALMSLVAIREAGLAQPALCIGLCPWTYVGNRGASLFANDRYDWVQGHMAMRYADWLIGNSGYSAEAISPMAADFRGLAPIYLQAGGREILYDMIVEFARSARERGANVELDTWDSMPHDFQAFGDYLPQSREALARIADVIAGKRTPRRSQHKPQ